VLVASQSLIMHESDGVLYIKTAGEMAPRPTEHATPKP
jgi:hypothetical protein